MLMTDGQVREALNKGEFLLEGFEEGYLQPSSYDMRVGSIGLVSGRDEEVSIGKGRAYVLRPNEFGILTTFEKIKLPNNMAGHIGLRGGWARKGLVLLAGLQIDPGFEGHLILGLYNASPRRLVLDHKDAVCTVEFHKLEENVAQPYMTPIEFKEGRIPSADRVYLRQLETTTLSDLATSVGTLTQNVALLTAVIKWLAVPVVLSFLAALYAALFK